MRWIRTAKIRNGEPRSSGSRPGTAKSMRKVSGLSISAASRSGSRRTSSPPASALERRLRSASAACALGVDDARRAWARQVGLARLGRIRAVQRERAAATAPYTSRLWELKGQQLRALRDGRDAEPATTELRRLAGQMTAELDQFLRERSRAFSEIDMPIDAARQLIIVAVDRFISTRFAAEISF